MSKPRTCLYVSFDDDAVDPTFSSAKDCLLVEVEGNKGEDNPCTSKDIVGYVPLVPRDCDDARILCEMLGWSYDYDNDGQLVIYTGFRKK